MSQDEKKAPQGPESIMQMLLGLQVSGILSAGIALDVFSQLAPAALSAENLATRIHCPPRSTRILLDSLAALGLVTKSEPSAASRPQRTSFWSRENPRTWVG